MATYDDLKAEIKEQISHLRKNRGTHKRKIIIYLRKLMEFYDSSTSLHMFVGVV